MPYSEGHIETMNNDNDIIAIINNYINSNLYICNDAKEIVKQFENLSKFIEQLNSYPQPNEVERIINSNYVIQYNLNILCSKYINEIKSGEYTIIFSELIQLFIEIYYYTNHLEMDEIEIMSEELVETSKSSKEYEVMSDSANIYLGDIGKIPLLTFDEEKELSKQVAAGSIEARNRLVEANLRFVIFIAKKYMGRGVSLQDLIQVGNEGLISAAERFDASRGCRFITYAYHWIRNNIQREIYNNGKTIRIPINVHEQYFKLYKHLRLIYQETGRTPSFQELAEVLGTTKEKAEELFTIYNNCDTRSLDASIKLNSEYSELEDFLASEEDLEENIINESLKDEVLDIIMNLDSLTDKEKEVLILRYGFIDDKVMSLESIADLYGLTKQRIKQIEKNGLKKLKNFYKSLDKQSYQFVKNNSLLGKTSDSETLKDTKENFEIWKIIGCTKKEYIDYIEPELFEKEKELMIKYQLNELTHIEKLELLKAVLRFRAILYELFGKKKYEPIVKKDIWKIIRCTLEEYNEKIVPYLYPDELALIEKRTVYSLSINEHTQFQRAVEIARKILENPTFRQKNNSNSKVDVSENISGPIMHFNINPKYISQTDYFEIIKLLKSRAFKNLGNNIPEQDALICCLRLSYINQKKFSIDDIASILNVDVDEVRKVVCKLKEYKSFLKIFLIEKKSEEENKTLILMPKDRN